MLNNCANIYYTNVNPKRPHFTCCSSKYQNRYVTLKV